MWVFDRHPDTPTRARHLAAATLRDEHPDLPVEAWAETLLLLTEMVTNAVRYGDDPVQVRLGETDGGLRVSVTDHGDGLPVPRANEDWLAEGGRGLVLVERLAARWGIEVEGVSKTVWFETEVPGLNH